MNIESVRAARLQLIDLGDEKTAATLDWCLSTPAAADAPEPVALTDEQIGKLASEWSSKDETRFVGGFARQEITFTGTRLVRFVHAVLAASQPARPQAVPKRLTKRAPEYTGEVIDLEENKRLANLFAGKTVESALAELGLKPAAAPTPSKGEA